MMRRGFDNKKPPVVRAAVCTCLGVCYFFTLTVAILTESRSLIIRTTITMTIRERLNSELMLAEGISPDYRQIQK
jgi:hypothetical protein